MVFVACRLRRAGRRRWRALDALQRMQQEDMIPARKEPSTLKYDRNKKLLLRNTYNGWSGECFGIDLDEVKKLEWK
jgi:hypothetical protein